MPKQDRVAVGALPGALDHDAVSGRLHRSPARRREVHAPMRPPYPQHRMEPAVCETAGNPVTEGDRAEKECESHGFPVLVVVRTGPVSVGVKPNGRKSAPLVYQLGREDVPDAHGSVRANRPFEGETVEIPRSDLPDKVSLPFENIVQNHE